MENATPSYMFMTRVTAQGSFTASLQGSIQRTYPVKKSETPHANTATVAKQ